MKVITNLVLLTFHNTIQSTNCMKILDNSSFSDILVFKYITVKFTPPFVAAHHTDIFDKPFPSSPLPLYQNKASLRAKPFIWKCAPLQAYFHANQIARRPVLTHRNKATQKWPATLYFEHCNQPHTSFFSISSLLLRSSSRIIRYHSLSASSLGASPLSMRT